MILENKEEVRQATKAKSVFREKEIELASYQLRNKKNLIPDEFETFSVEDPKVLAKLQRRADFIELQDKIKNKTHFQILNKQII